MNPQTFISLHAIKSFRIPTYKSGYHWSERQLEHFIQDIDSIINHEISAHYMGTIILYTPVKRKVVNYGNGKKELFDLIDGQQRFVTIYMYLSIILKELIKSKQNDYDFKKELSYFVYAGGDSRIILNNDCSTIFYDLVSKGTTELHPKNTYQKNILDAYYYLENHIKNQNNNENAFEYFRALLIAITSKLKFSYYQIELESEIDKTIEIIKKRG